MFGQYQPPALSAAKWIFTGFIIIVLMAVLLGADIKNATWLNSEIASAEAKRLEIEAAHQQATYELQEQLAQAQTEAEIREIQRQQGRLDAQYQHDVEALSLDLVHQDLAFRTWMNILVIIAGAFALTLFLSTVIWVGSRALVHMRYIPQKGELVTKAIPPIEKRIPNLSERRPYDPWNSPAYRRRKRTAAQQAERKEREEIVARMMSFRDPGRLSTEEINNSPEAD